METKIIFTTIKQDFNLLKQIFDYLKKHQEKTSNCIRIFISGLDVKAYFDDNSLIKFNFHQVGEKFIFSELEKENYINSFPNYSDEVILKMSSELKGKTKLLKKLKNKLRKAYTIGELQKILDFKSGRKVNSYDYYGYSGFDDVGYRRENDQNEAEVQLLKDLMDRKLKKYWFPF